MGALKGIRIVEFAGLGAAPMCGMMLADLGAEVFLVDRKSERGPEATMHVKNKDMLNRGKLPIRVNLKNETELEMVLQLIDKSHGLLESFRPGVMERLGIGPDVCRLRNPRLVYARMTGWGQDGPLSHAAGHDPNYVALTGALYHTGDEQHSPQSPPTLLGDAAGGAAVTALGICAGLIAALQKGKGQVIDAAIGEGTSYLTTMVRSLYNVGQMTDERGKSWMEGAAPWSRAYACADGEFITLLPVEARFYRSFLELMGLTEHAAFGDAHQYDASRWAEQCDVLEGIFASEAREHWCELLEGTDTCFAPVMKYSDAHTHKHNQARGNFVEVDDDWYPIPAPRFSETPHTPDWGGLNPNAAVEPLRALGFDEDFVQLVTVR